MDNSLNTDSPATRIFMAQFPDAKVMTDAESRAQMIAARNKYIASVATDPRALAASKA